MTRLARGVENQLAADVHPVRGVVERVQRRDRQQQHPLLRLEPIPELPEQGSKLRGFTSSRTRIVTLVSASWPVPSRLKAVFNTSLG